MGQAVAGGRYRVEAECGARAQAQDGPRHSLRPAMNSSAITANSSAPVTSWTSDASLPRGASPAATTDSIADAEGDVEHRAAAAVQADPPTSAAAAAGSSRSS